LVKRVYKCRIIGLPDRRKSKAGRQGKAAGNIGKKEQEEK
jgi:hypothetical protein